MPGSNVGRREYFAVTPKTLQHSSLILQAFDSAFGVGHTHSTVGLQIAVDIALADQLPYRLDGR